MGVSNKVSPMFICVSDAYKLLFFDALTWKNKYLSNASPKLFANKTASSYLIYQTSSLISVFGDLHALISFNSSPQNQTYIVSAYL